MSVYSCIADANNKNIKKMTKFFLHIYDILKGHKPTVVVFLLIIVVVEVWLMTSVHYEEDISKFLPRNEHDKGFTAEFEKLSRQGKIAILFSSADSLHPAASGEIDAAKEYVADNLGYDAGGTDMAYLFQNMPYMLTDKDYKEIDYKLRHLDINETLQADKMLMLMPTGGVASDMLSYDPLHLFSGVLQRMKPDNSRQVISFDSPYGSSETGKNALLADSLEVLMNKAQTKFPSVKISAVGGPVIAVSNARQIKKDSFIAVGIASLLILLLLAVHYRKLSDILFIGLSLAMGWLFAIAGMALIKDSVSIIVLGIGSVIIGIAVNYPLHYIDHLREVGSHREALRDMVQPLLIGNITTVAAFLCLIWLDAQAMRDLGLFGGLMLIGTILFVLIFLPLFVSEGKAGKKSLLKLDFHLPYIPHLSLAVVIITVVLGYFSLRTSFDSNLQNINYMTTQQREDMRWLTAFVGETAVNGNTSDKISKWNNFWASHDMEKAKTAAVQQGFSEDAFAPFWHLTETKFSGDDANNVGRQLVNVLNDSFNYIGYVCAFVVFFFLWFSFGSIELALMSFLPLAVSWIWILGLMQLFGIQFNIVNIILATFIFGQGDDYTIFITEGLMYEYSTGKKRLAAYKRSIMLSAILMFIGIGCLVFAGHPALRSLGAVTLIGMATVVMMAYYIPPLIFRWLTMKKGERREVPITLKRLIYSFNAMLFFLVFMYLGALPYTWLYFHIGKLTEQKKLRYHELIKKVSDWMMRHIPGVNFTWDNSVGETFSRPAVIICNHQSHFDIMCLLRFSPKMIIVTNNWTWHNPFYGMVIHHAEFLPAAEGMDTLLPQLQSLYKRGYSIVIFPEGTRSEDCHIMRFHKGAFYVAQKLGADILPMYIHGQGHVLPKKDFMLREGDMYIEVGRRIKAEDAIAKKSLLEFSKDMRHHYQKHYAELCSRIETDDYWAPYHKSQNTYRL